MKVWEKLSDEMQKVIYDMGWTELREIQEKGIQAIIDTDKHVILSANTASGKTEAAFLPILSTLNNTNKCAVLYIAPLKTLLNNQYERITDLIRYTDYTVMKWHGDVSNHLKQKFRKEPTTILQITPEAFENMLMNNPASLKSIFKDLEYVVIDEFHYFLESDRGYQLRSQLHRLERYIPNKPRMICLSATLNITKDTLDWIDFNHDNIEVIKVENKDRKILASYFDFSVHPSKMIDYQQVLSKKDLNISNDFTEGKPFLQTDFYKDVFDVTKDMKSIIFVNNKIMLERMTMELNEMQKQKKYLIHHGSLSKEIREAAEFQMMKRTDVNILATSTLELGVDIGDVDCVVQIGDTNSVSSLKQRLGRAGRKGQPAYFQQYSLNTISEERQLKILAMMTLLDTDFVEEVKLNKKPYHLLFHQTLSMLKEYGEIPIKEYITLVKQNPMLKNFTKEELKKFLMNLEEKQLIEIVNGLLLLYTKGEMIVNHYDFLTLFVSEQQIQVIDMDKKKIIGMILDDGTLEKGNQIILAGKGWSIVSFNQKENKLFVKRIRKAKNVNFERGEYYKFIHHEVAGKMLEVINDYRQGDDFFMSKYPYINDTVLEFLEDEASLFPVIENDKKVKVIFDDDLNLMNIYAYLGEDMLNVFLFLLRKYNIQYKETHNNQKISLFLHDISEQHLLDLFDYELTYEEMYEPIFNEQGEEQYIKALEKFSMFLRNEERAYLSNFSCYHLENWNKYKHFIKDAILNKELKD